MMTRDKVKWLNYRFDVYDPASVVKWSPTGGVYLFAAQSDPPGRWRVLYVGQTDSFALRLRNHPKWDGAHFAGATHVHVMSVPDRRHRQDLERRIIRELQPPMNRGV